MAKILLIGCGKMGQAILNGWLKSGIAKSDISIIDPLAQVQGFEVSSDITSYQGEPDFVLLAIKPQLADELLPLIGEKCKSAVFVSIMAGKTTHHLSTKLLSMEVIRAMPNLPATIGSGFTALYAPARVDAARRAEVLKLFEACGKLVWLDDESQMDAITALSGSGPAYIFLFAEALVQAGVELGLPKELAKQAALQTILGGADFAAQSDDDLVQLQEAVTSKGGTTAAALEVFKDGDALKTLVSRAMAAAHKRSIELAE